MGSLSLAMWPWEDAMRDMIGNSQDDNKTIPSDTLDGTFGTVVRLAARDYDPEHSKPSSPKYTTRKTEFSSRQVFERGMEGDYNHYRTTALKSTKDRAISILTTDVMKSMRATYGNYEIQEGDLGENMLVDGVTFRFFQIGQCYQFTTRSSGGASNPGEDFESCVIVEITEPIEPCANLCKLPYINDDGIKPKERIERCKDFIVHLDRFDGYRGWYAKVHSEGTVRLGANVSLVTTRAAS